MRVMFDLDGVMVNFTETFTEWAHSQGYPIKPIKAEDQETWNFFKKQGFDDSQVWDKLKDSWNWWMQCKPLVQKFEIGMINSLMEMGQQFYFITNRPSTRGLSAEQQSEQWLRGIGIDTFKASVIATKGSKGALCKALDITLAIDDKPDNILDLKKHGIKTVTRAWKYNEGHTPRVKSVEEFLYAFIINPK